MTTHERLTPAVLRRWAVLARSSLAAHRDDIDGLNVFPVPDADTGTNMFLTLDAAVEATLDVEAGAAAQSTPDVVDDLDRFARAALLGARGNSGVIVSQLVRGFVEGLRDTPDGPDGAQTARAFGRAARAGYAAVDRPAEGTILTVADAAAGAATAEAEAGGGLADVIRAACSGARAALAATTDQLDALTDAGVVDAGGAGLVVVLEALRSVVLGEVEPLAAIEPRPGAGACATPAYSGPRYEVMWVTAQADDAAIAELRTDLARLGDSVLVVAAGADGPWRGHVHTADPEAVLAAASRLGEPRSVTVQDLHAQSSTQGPATLLVPAAGAGLRVVVAEAGAVATERAGGLAGVEAALERLNGRVLLVPGSADLLAECEGRREQWAARGVEVLPAPTDAHVIAALAVHAPDTDADEHLAEAVEAVRAEVLPVGAVPDDAGAVILRLQEQVGELGLVTLVLGAGQDARTWRAAVDEAARGAEVSVVEGGDPGYAVTIGVER